MVICINWCLSVIRQQHIARIFVVRVCKRIVRIEMVAPDIQHATNKLIHKVVGKILILVGTHGIETLFVVAYIDCALSVRVQAWGLSDWHKHKHWGILYCAPYPPCKHEPKEWYRVPYRHRHSYSRAMQTRL